MPNIQTTKVYSEIQTAYDAGYTTVSEQGSSRSGKTFNTVIWIVLRCLLVPGTTVSIVRATFPALRGSVYRDFREVMIERLKIWNERAMNKNEFVYTFPNGSWIEFFSCDSEQKMRGRKRKILYVNEGNELSFIQWQQLQMRTTEFSIIDYNPSFTDQHWLMGLNREAKTYHFITTYNDNPFLEQKVIDEIESLREKNASLWQIYGLGQQAVIEGLIFTNVEVVPEIPAFVKHRCRGMDFGYSHDPTAIVEIGFKDNDFYIDEICYRTEMLASDIIKVLKADGAEKETISESADPRLIEEIYRAGINIRPVQKYPGSVLAGITKMLEFNIKVTQRSTNAIKELKNYTWMQDKEGHFLNQPIDAFNHILDASRYVCIMKILGGKRKAVDMKVLEGMAY